MRTAFWHTTAVGGVHETGFSGFVGRVREALQRRRVDAAKRRQLMRELNSMSDRDLAELGFGRADIDRIALGLPISQ